MTENKRYIITLETVVEAEDIFEAVTIGTELSKKYKEDKFDLKGVMVDGSYSWDCEKVTFEEDDDMDG